MRFLIFLLWVTKIICIGALFIAAWPNPFLLFAAVWVIIHWDFTINGREYSF